jgi:hypothetical protein
MRSLSFVTVALIATAFCGASPASAGACIQDEYGRTACGPEAFYAGAWTTETYDPLLAWPTAFCPPGTVAGNYTCVRWRALPGAVKCPPNMWLVDGMCRPYSQRW